LPVSYVMPLSKQTDKMEGHVSSKPLSAGGVFISYLSQIIAQTQDLGEILNLLLYLSIILEMSNLFFFPLGIFSSFLYLNPAYDSVTLCG